MMQHSSYLISELSVEAIVVDGPENAFVGAVGVVDVAVGVDGDVHRPDVEFRHQKHRLFFDLQLRHFRGPGAFEAAR